MVTIISGLALTWADQGGKKKKKMPILDLQGFSNLKYLDFQIIKRWPDLATIFRILKLCDFYGPEKPMFIVFENTFKCTGHLLVCNPCHMWKVNIPWEDLKIYNEPKISQLYMEKKNLITAVYQLLLALEEWGQLVVLQLI